MTTANGHARNGHAAKGKSPARPSLWKRLAAGVRHVWRGEAIGGDELGYPVNPLDLYDGLKGQEFTLYSALAMWRRTFGPDGLRPRPAHHQITDAHYRQLARILEKHNPFAQAIFSALRSYVLGETGLAVEVTVREDVTPDDDDEQLQKGAQEYLDAFMDREDWWARERELFTRCHRDGEGIVRFFADKEGVRLRFVEPECVVAPETTPEWSEGVRQADDDAETLEAIYVQTGEKLEDGEEVTADEIHFIKCNVDRCVRRGVSDFASIADLVVKALDCTTSAVGAETVRQGIVMITQHEQSAPADLDSFLNSQTDYVDRSGPYRQGGPERDVPTQAVTGVREIHLTGTQKLAAAPTGQVDAAVNAVNTALLSAGSRYHMPLWVISGDASRNNAMDLQAEGPFGRYIKDEQAWYTKHVRSILWRVLEIAVDRGDLHAQTLVALDLSVSPQNPTEQRDPRSETERNKMLFDGGLMGKPTWASREGLDFQIEQDDLERHGGPPRPPDEAIPQGMKAIPKGSPSAPGIDPGQESGVGGQESGTPDAGESGAAKSSVGGLQAILALQHAVYAGEVPRQAAIANAEVVFGFTPEQAARLFPEVPPEKTADDSGPGVRSQESGVRNPGPPAPGMAGEEEEPTGPQNVDPGVLADLFYGLYGDGALDAIRSLGKSDEDPVGEAWDEGSHPRGKGGMFITKGSAEAVGAAQDVVRRVLGGDASVEPSAVMEHLNILTVKQINQLAKEHGKTAPKLKRAELVDAVTQIMGQNAAKPDVAGKMLDTSAVAKHAEVAPRTVSKWVDSGVLPGVRDATTGNRTVSEPDLAAFFIANGMPVPAGLSEVKPTAPDEFAAKVQAAKAKLAPAPAVAQPAAAGPTPAERLAAASAPKPAGPSPAPRAPYRDLSLPENNPVDEWLDSAYYALPAKERTFATRGQRMKHRATVDAANRAKHKVAVKAALAAGKTVPPEVLADYPDLAKGQDAAKKEEPAAAAAAPAQKPPAGDRVADAVAKATEFHDTAYDPTRGEAGIKREVAQLLAPLTVAQAKEVIKGVGMSRTPKDKAEAEKWLNERIVGRLGAFKRQGVEAMGSGGMTRGAAAAADPATPHDVRPAVPDYASMATPKERHEAAVSHEQALSAWADRAGSARQHRVQKLSGKDRHGREWKRGKLVSDPLAKAAGAAPAAPPHAAAAGKVKGLMARAGSPGTTRGDVESALAGLGLEKMSGPDLHALARSVPGVRVKGKGRKALIEAIRRAPLEIQEMSIRGGG